jgi:hypothetical protein
LVYNLDTGTELANQSGVISTTCEAIGSSWWRITMTVEQDDMRWYLYTTDGTETLVDDVTVTLQDAQLEQGLVATPYIHRTDSYSKSTAGIQEDEPRYDYSLDNDAPPVLMLEPERINLVTRSEGTTNLNLTTGVTEAYDFDEVSPTGFKEGVVEVSNLLAASGDRCNFTGPIIAADRGEDFTGSCFVKGTSGEKITYYIKRSGGDSASSPDVVHTFNGEWQRISATFTSEANNTDAAFYLKKQASSTADSCFIWGYQIEKGSCVTSYIPTYGSAATRETDTIPQYTPSSTNLDKYTFFVHSHSDRVTPDNRAPRLKGDGNSALMGIYVNTEGKKQFFLYDNENNSALSKATFGSFEAGDDTKYAFVVDNIALEAKLFIDGVLRETISLTERVDAKIISVGNSDGNPDRIKSIMYFPEALEDADAVSLTT